MKATYSFSERGKVKDLFMRYFNRNVGEFTDNFLSVATKKVKIDIFKFDDWLHTQVGDYESTGKNMTEILAEKYGLDARDLI